MNAMNRLLENYDLATPPLLGGSETLLDFICDLEAEEFIPGAYLDTRSFLELLHEHFCVAAGGAGKLYEHYELRYSQHSLKTFVAIPAQIKNQQGIAGINHEVLENSQVYVMDGGLVGLKGLALAIQHGNEFSTLPLQDGMDWLQELYAEQGGFVPVLSTRHLRAISNLSLVRISRLRVEAVAKKYQSGLLDAITRKLNLLKVECNRAA